MAFWKPFAGNAEGEDRGPAHSWKRPVSDSLAVDLADRIDGSNLQEADKVEFLIEFLRANFDTVQDAADDAGTDLGEESGPDPWTRLANELLAE